MITENKDSLVKKLTISTGKNYLIWFKFLVHPTYFWGFGDLGIVTWSKSVLANHSNFIFMINFTLMLYILTLHFIFLVFRDNPAERIGYQKGGIQDLQKHK